MGIKAFSYFVRNEAKPCELKDSNVVIDAQNYLYNIYEKSQLPFTLGCESNRFAKFLKEHLSTFKAANLNCYFVFKGGSKDLRKKFEKKKRMSSKAVQEFVLPIFAFNICKQLLAEMNFEYVTCPLEAKEYCINLAYKLDCPVISEDQEYALSMVSYIPYREMLFDRQTNSFKCVKFNLDYMLKKYRLNQGKLELFIVLTNTNCFPENHFINFLQNNNIPLNNYHRIVYLLKWLSVRTVEEILHNIFKHINDDDRNKFRRMLQETSENLRKKRKGLPADVFLYGDRLRIIRNDPKWFEKGVFNKYIAKPYTDLYYSNVYLYKSTIHSSEGKNEYLLSTDIIVYAYNLLTNYTKDHFSLTQSTGEVIMSVDTRTLPFPKPVYEADHSVFENGWDTIKNLRLLEHFLDGTMRGIELKYLDELPEDAKLLMISITYYTIKSPNETIDELYSIFLSYIMLGIVFEDRDDVNIIRTDCKSAIDATKAYFRSDETEIECISDKNLIHPLIEFEHCLEEMNYLNALCGSPYKPTIYSKTYNGTFVYKILHSLKTKDFDREDFFENVLQLPPTVYNYLQNLSIIHERLISSIDN